MKELTKKIIVTMIILSMLVVAIPVLKVNAEDEETEDDTEFVLDETTDEEDEETNDGEDETTVDGEEPLEDDENEEETDVTTMTYNGITLESVQKYTDFPGGIVKLTIESEDADAVLKGIQATVEFEGAVPYEAVSLTEDWFVSTYNVEGKKIYILVEPTEEVLGEEELEQSVTIKIKFNEESQDSTIYASINKESFKTTYDNNDVREPLNLDEITDLIVIVEETEGNPVSALEEETAIVDLYDVYVKLNGDINNEGLVDVLSVLDVLEIDDSWMRVDIYTNTNEAGIWTIERTDLDTEYGETLRETSLGNAYKVVFYTDYGACEYNLHQMGNVYVEDVYVGGVININDVTWLRQAVVGIEDALNDADFHVENSDVNFSNSELGTLGDIGDIIAIRERILNYVW